MPSPSARKARHGGVAAADLAARIATAPLRGVPAARADRARRLLSAWLDTAGRGGLAGDALLRAMGDGTAAGQVATALSARMAEAPPPEVSGAACAAGCAFCCILDGPDGGTITHVEARALHDALTPVAGRPDGRDWHPAACPALDPDTRTCRAYEARPSLCRSFFSTDAAACRANAEGGREAGAGLVSPHLDMLAVHALARAATAGLAPAPTYALREVAAAAVAGEDRPTALKRARHPDTRLARTLSQGARAAAAAR